VCAERRSCEAESQHCVLYHGLPCKLNSTLSSAASAAGVKRWEWLAAKRVHVLRDCEGAQPIPYSTACHRYMHHDSSRVIETSWLGPQSQRPMLENTSGETILSLSHTHVYSIMHIYSEAIGNSESIQTLILMHAIIPTYSSMSTDSYSGRSTVSGRADSMAGQQNGMSVLPQSQSNKTARNIDPRREQC
jgi:hypothetical protein